MNDMELMNQNNWTELFRRYNHKIVAICKGDDDIAQDIWIKLFKQKDGFKFGTFMSWATIIAKNEFIDHKRRKNRNLKHETNQEVNYNLIAAEPDIESKEPDFEKLDRLIDKLSPSQREIVLLRRRFKFWEIAEITNTCISTARGNMGYAIKNLRKMW